MTKLVVVMMLCLVGQSEAAWMNISHGLKEQDIYEVAVHPRDPQIIFAASKRRVYRTRDGGQTWKQALGVRGADNEIYFVYVDPVNPEWVYAGTADGLKRSEDSGKRWKLIFQGAGVKANRILSMHRDSQTGKIWVGTADGLYVAHSPSEELQKAPGISDASVTAILVREHQVFVTTDGGIYRGSLESNQWQKVFVNPLAERDIFESVGDSNSLQQFSVEEIQRVPAFSNMVSFSATGQIFAASAQGLLESSSDGLSWETPDGQNLPDEKINDIASTPDNLYTATDKGVFRWDKTNRKFEEIYDGLDSTQTRAILYSAMGNYLLAATSRGVFRWSYPELKLTPQTEGAGKEIQLMSLDIFGRFEAEPTIGEVQKAAIYYAEVHPKKIQAWRTAAMRKAWLPAVSLDYDVSRDENIDLDRGGTNDPDKFIQGPEERSRDWSVGVSWDLGDLIWNDDQTSIDTRSKLMVELRDDILTEVTHFYFERRRLQVEMELAPATRELPVQIEKELRLQELTANIDALTGGYFSQELEKRSYKT